MTEARRRDAIALSSLALLPAVFFFRVLTGERCLYLRDLSNFHYPGKKLLREIVLGGEFPYWNPFLSAGQPLAANPQHEVFYPLTWLILLPSYFTGFHLLVVAHVAIALLTMYALLRSMRIAPPAAAIGAISYGLGGVVMSMLNLLPFLFSAAWLPLTCLFARRFLRDGRWTHFSLASLSLAMQLLIGEPVTALQTGLLLAFFGIWRARARGLASVAFIGLAALFVAAVQILPAVDHLRDSVRGQSLDFDRVASWSMPLIRLAEVVNPDFLGDPAGDLAHWRGARLYPGHVVPFYFSIYAGLLMAVATLGGLVARVRGTALVLSVLLLSTLLAAGHHTPLLRLLYDAGIGGHFRFPEKYFLMAAFTMVVFGSRVLQSLLDGDDRVRKHLIAVAGGLTLITVAMAVATSAANGWPLTAARSLLLLLLFAFVRRISPRMTLAVLIAFVIIDLAPIAQRLSPTLPASFYTDAPKIVRAFPADRQTFRIFHLAAWDQRNPDALGYVEPAVGRYWAFRNSLVPITPATHGLRLVLNSDYDATSLVPSEDFVIAAVMLSKRAPRTWIDTVAAMSNVHYVSLYEPFANALARARGDFRDIQPVRFVASRPYPRYYFATQIVPVAGREEFVERLARHPYDLRAAFVDRTSTVGRSLSHVKAGHAATAARGSVLEVREQANRARIDVAAEGWSFLVMSVTPHKYWRVTVDGVLTDAIVTNVGYQGVVVPAGRHVVEMAYRNPLVAAGGVVSVVAVLALALISKRRPLDKRGITMRAL